MVGAAIGVRYLLRDRPSLCDAITVGTSAGGLILAGAVLSQNPWRSVDGYAGHSAGVQLLALISVARWRPRCVGERETTASLRPGISQSISQSTTGSRRALASAECRN